LQPKIPREIHLVWFTKPSRVKEPVEIEDQRQMVEASAQTVRDKMNSGRNESDRWKMTLWTNDRSLLPRTEEWAKGLGMQMREINELPIFE
jgi:hypothetical protein